MNQQAEAFARTTPRCARRRSTSGARVGVVAAARIGAPARERRRAPTPTTSPSSPARCTRRSACRRNAHARIVSIDLDAVRATPGVVAVLDRRRHPRRQRLRPDHPRRSDPRRRRRAVRRPAGVRRDRRNATTLARRAARCAKSDDVMRYEPLEPILTPREAHAAQSSTCCRRCTCARGDAATRRSPRAPHRLSGTLEVGGQEQFYLEGQIAYAVPKEDDGMHVYCSTQHPSEMQHLVAHALGLAVAQRACANAGAWAAASAARNRSRRCSRASRRSRRSKLRRPVKLRARPRRRLHDHRQAPRLPLRRTKSASTTTAASLGARVDMISRAAFRPTCRAR